MRRIGGSLSTPHPTLRQVMITALLALAVLIPAFGPAISSVHALSLGKPGTSQHSTPQPARQPRKQSNTSTPGSLLWSYRTDGALRESPTVVNGVVYVSDYFDLYAVDAGNGGLVWSYLASNGVGFYGAPVVADGEVYAGLSDTTGTVGYVYSLDAAHGTLLWTWGFPTGDSPTDDALAVANGVAYAGSVDGYIYAFEATSGSLIWSYQTGGLINTTPKVVNGVLYASSYDGYVYALNAATGARLWRYQTGSSFLAVVNGTLFVDTENGVRALNAASGALLWSYQQSQEGASSSLIVVNSVVYIGMSGVASSLYALNAASGALLWSYDIQEGSPDSLAVASGVVYEGSGDDSIYALNATSGALLWSYHTGHTNNCTCYPAVVVNGVVYISSDDGSTYAFNAMSGVLQWSYYVDDAFLSSPVVVNAVVYANSYYTIYAFAASASGQGPIGTERYGGNPSELLYCYQCAGDPIDTYSGYFSHTFTDLSIPGRGLPLDFTRTYNAQVASANGLLGYGWTDSYNWALSVDGGTGNVTITQENGSTVTFAPAGGGAYTAPSRVLATLVKNGDGSYTFTRLQDQTHYSFNSSGQLTAETDRNGYVTALAYNGGGQLTSVTDPAGRALTFAYDGSGRVTSVTDPGSRSVAFTYDGSGNLQTATDVNGGMWHFTYDATHLLLTMTDPRGGVVTNVYDGSARVSSQTDAMNRKTTFSYTGPDGSGNSSTTITDPRGIITVDQYYNGLPLSETKGSGTAQAATWSYTYDPISLGLASTTDPNGNITTQTWDASGNLLSRTDPLGRTAIYTYDTLNDLLTSTDPNGVTTSHTYDAHGNLLTTSTPLVGTSSTQTTTYTYGDSSHPGDVTALRDPDGKTWHYAYDTYGDCTSGTDPLGDVTSNTYNVLGERTAATNPLGQTTHTSYDAFGDVTSVIDPLGHATSYQFDADRNQTQVTDADGNVTQSTYDLDNERTKTTRADGSTLTYAYDADGNQTSQTDGLGHVTTYAYDPLNRLVSLTDPLNRTTSYAYDPAGNRVSLTAPGSLVTSYSYDAANELTGVSYSDGVTHAVSYTYDADGQRLSMSDGTGTTTDTHDSLHRLTKETNGAGQTLSYGYDLIGRLTSLTYPNGKSVIRAYDAADRLTSVADWLGNTTRFYYDKASELTDVYYANHDLDVLGYNPAGQLTSQSYNYAPCFGTTPACRIAWFFRFSLSYNRDNAGLLTGTITSGPALPNQPAQSDLYTQLQQIASVSVSGGGTTSYQYDKADEPVQLGADFLTFDKASELTQLTVGTMTTNFTYNQRGDRTRATQGAGTTSYAYDQASRLTGYTQGTTTASYTFNGDGLRLRKTVNGTAEAFTWDTAEGLPLLVQDGTTSFVTGASGLPLEQIDASGHVLFFLRDQLGSTRALADSTGAVVATYTYDAYGNLTASTGTPSTPLRFAGQYRDGESGLYYLRARSYDPATGQFLSVDPLASQTKARYGYAYDDPLNLVDSSGLAVALGCDTVSASWFYSVQVQICAGQGPQETIVTETVSVGAQSTPGLGATTGLQVDPTANTAKDLQGNSAYVSGNGGIVSGSASIPLDSCSPRPSSYDWEFGVKTDPGFGGGTSHTWAQSGPPMPADFTFFLPLSRLFPW